MTDWMLQKVRRIPFPVPHLQVVDLIRPAVSSLLHQAVLLQMRENMSNEVKGFIREALDRMVDPLLAAAERELYGSGGGDGGQSRSGGAPPAIHPAQQEAEMAERLAALPHAAFMQVGGWVDGAFEGVDGEFDEDHHRLHWGVRGE